MTDENTVQVWLKGHDDEKATVTIHCPRPLTSMNVKDWCCRTGLYSWADYQRIRYKRVKNRCVKCDKFTNPSKECLFYNVGGLSCRYEKEESS